MGRVEKNRFHTGPIYQGDHEFLWMEERASHPPTAPQKFGEEKQVPLQDILEGIYQPPPDDDLNQRVRDAIRRINQG